MEFRSLTRYSACAFVGIIVPESNTITGAPTCAVTPAPTASIVPVASRPRPAYRPSANDPR